MVGQPEILAIVPARGGSKSIPRKNIRPLAGHPLLAYSIAAGLQAEPVTRVIVSTDDAEIAKIARRYGAEVPFMRPAALAQDDTTDYPVFKHALDWLKEHESYSPDIVVHLRPTSPLRPLDCVTRSIKLMDERPDADSVRGVIPSGQNPYKMWRILETGNLASLISNDFSEPYNMPRQKLPATYWQTGHIDAVRRRTIESGSLSGKVILPLVLDSRYAVDIDSERDHERAEWIIRQGELALVMPGNRPRPLPDIVEWVLLDFDGVLTDNRVWINEQGLESVAADRSDGLGIGRLLEHGVRVMVLSTEPNPVVTARCKKLGIEALQGIDDKGAAVDTMFRERKINPERTIYVGNDVNDLAVFSRVACALAVSDSHPDIRSSADIVLKHKGGYGAVREVCDIVLSKQEAKKGDG